MSPLSGTAWPHARARLLAVTGVITALLALAPAGAVYAVEPTGAVTSSQPVHQVGFAAMPMRHQADDTSTSPNEVAEATDPVRVTLTGLAPVVITRKTTLVLTGHAFNTTLSDLTSVSVRLTLSATPLPDRRSIRKVSYGATGLDGTPIEGTDTLVAQRLRPGAKRTFKVSFKGADLPVTAAGVYVIGVEVVGYNADSYVVLGTGRTLMPWMPYPTAPVRVSWLWPFSGTPAVAPDGTLLSDLVPKEISTGGRLRNLLDVAAESSDDISWVLDPQLLQQVTSMSRGYVLDQHGTVGPGTAQTAASTWMDTMKDALGNHSRQKSDKPVPPVWSLPYADTDADAVVRAGLDTDVVRAITSAPLLVRQTLQRPSDGSLYWSPGGRITPGALDLLGSSGISAVVLRDTVVPPTTPLDYTPSGYTDLDTRFGLVRALLIDSALLDTVTMPQGNRAQILAARQRFLSELAFVDLQNPTVGTHIIAAAGSTRWSPNPRLLRSLLASMHAVPWARLVSVQEVLDLPSSNLPRALADYTNEDKSRELSDSYMGHVAAEQKQLEALRAVVVNPLSVTEPVAAAIQRSESAAWRTRPQGGLALLDTVHADLVAQMSKVYVVPRESVTLSGDRGSVPVTIANDFDQAVRIGVTLTGSPEARLTTEEVDAVTIEPGRRASLEIPVRIVGGETLPVSVQLVDNRGHVFGPPSSMELRTTAYSRAALWFAIAAAVVLVLLVVFDIVRRARSRRPRSTETPP